MRPVTDRGPILGAMASLLGGDPAVYVAEAARITGGRADAFVRIDAGEHARRCAGGLGAITQMWMLDVLMNLPLDQPVRVADLDADERWALDRIPAAAVRRDGAWVTRLCRPVAEIAAVVVWGRRLQPLLKRTAPFTRVAPRMIVLDQVPADFDEIAWQACFQGTGVWSVADGRAVELVVAEPVRHRYYTPGRWQVNESAYRAWFRAQPTPAPSSPEDPAESAPPGSGQCLPRSASGPVRGSGQQLRSAPS